MPAIYEGVEYEKSCIYLQTPGDPKHWTTTIKFPWSNEESRVKQKNLTKHCYRGKNILQIEKWQGTS